MTADATTLAIAAVEVATALGIVLFWVSWFRAPHDEPWLPAGYVAHERAFVWADGVLATVLVAAAALQVAEAELGASLGLYAGGMLAFLGVLDLAYFAREGMFARARDGLANAAVVAAVLVVSAVLLLHFA